MSLSPPFPPGHPSRHSTPPLIRVLTDDRAGNNAQVLGVAEALTWPMEETRLGYDRLVRLPNWLRGRSTLGLTAAAAAALDGGAVPDVAIAAGRRATPALRRLKQRHPQMVALQIMWPGAPTGGLDLIAVPAHDRAAGGSAPGAHPADPRVIVTLGAPNRVTPAKLQAAAADWARRFAAAGAGAGAGPRIGLLVGGSTKRAPFIPEDARQLGGMVAELARRTGGSVVATNSRRTGDAVTAALGASLAPCRYWLHDVAKGGGNPYFGILGLADLIVVTGDSMSMASEAASTGRPVAIFAPGGGTSKEARLHRALYAHGAARPLNADFMAAGETMWRYTPLQDAAVVATAVRRLVARSAPR